MANTKVTGDLIAGGTITTFNLADGSVTAAKLNSITTDNISEGTNLFYTDARVSTYLSSNNYITSTAIANSANWDEAYSWGDHALAGYLTTNAVDSVNAQTGVVVLDADDIDDTATTNKFTTQTDIDKLAGIEALADVTDATNVANAGALMSGTAALSDLVDVSSATPADGQVLTYDTTNGWQPEDSQGGSYIIEEISTNTTAQAEYLYVLTDTLTLTLPASPSVGDKVALSNLSGTTTPVVARNGNLIAGLAEDVTIDVENLSVEFIYSGANQGWIIFVDAVLGTTAGGSAIDGSGTTNYLSKWVDGNTLTDSVIYDDGTNVGIGTSSPDAKLDIASAGNLVSTGAFTNPHLALTLSASPVNDDSFAGITYATSNDANYGYSMGAKRTNAGLGNFEIRRHFNSATGTQIASFTGDGLCFGTDTAAANALDDYEEGTFTPTVFGGTTAGTTTYITQAGHYTKIGRQVNVTLIVNWLSLTGTGNMSIGGLPFTVANLTENTAVGSIAPNGLNWSGGTYLVAVAFPNGTNIYPVYMASDATSFIQQCVNEGAAVSITLTYFAA